MRSIFRKDFNGAFGFHVQVFLEFQLYLSTSVQGYVNSWTGSLVPFICRYIESLNKSLNNTVVVDYKP